MPSPSVSGAVRLAAITADPLDPAAVAALVADRAAGGIDLFLGMVRDHDGGRAVEALAYDAHPSAAARLAEVAAEVAGEFEVVALAAVHRVGELAIGDAAVICAVSAAHRPAAFAATRALIDRLKEQVPIWKRQRYRDGGEEWVDPTACSGG